MPASKPPDPKTPPKAEAQAKRQQRLAQALRDNLRRRKTAKTPGPPRENET
jgi:hypothetical protein